MIKIGLISDTHGTISRRTLSFFEPVNEIWHAGDIGTVALADELAGLKPFRAVYGNIDDRVLRRMFPGCSRFYCEDVEVLMTHISGYPGRYSPAIRRELGIRSPSLLIGGHSHILKVMYDKKHECLFMNPGAAGNKGFHRVCTALRFCIDGKRISDLEVLEFERTRF
ncbi:MAG: metallophosphoesterase [Mangrovibacterium sp.]